MPITQSLHFYNKVVNDLDPLAYEDLISLETMETLLRQRNYEPNIENSMVLGRKVIYSKSHRDRIYVTVFDGGHELPKGDVIGLIKMIE